MKTSRPDLLTIAQFTFGLLLLTALVCHKYDIFPQIGGVKGQRDYGRAAE